MKILKSTDDCKQFIEDTTNINSFIKNELLEHDASRLDKKAWSRSTKKIISSDSNYEWVLERISNLFDKVFEVEDNIWSKTKIASLVGMTERIFLHRYLDGDAAFIIITDSNDELQCWVFCCD